MSKMISVNNLLNSRTRISSYRNVMMGISILICCLLNSCKDRCKDMDCQNGGSCTDGYCNCPPGYSGPNCEVNVSANFIGTYNATETCPDLAHYTTNISVDSFNISQVKIAGFFNEGFSNLINATVNGTAITVSPQSPDNDGRIVSGAGSFIPPDEIDWNYSVSGPSGSTSCSNSVWIKQ